MFGGSAADDGGDPLFYNDLYCLTRESCKGLMYNFIYFKKYVVVWNYLGTAGGAKWEVMEQKGDVPTSREGHSLLRYVHAMGPLYKTPLS